jgi:hypothetical protein
MRPKQVGRNSRVVSGSVFSPARLPVLRPVREDEEILHGGCVNDRVYARHHFRLYFIQDGRSTWSVLINRLPCQTPEFSCCLSIHIVLQEGRFLSFWKNTVTFSEWIKQHNARRLWRPIERYCWCCYGRISFFKLCVQAHGLSPHLSPPM